VVASNGDWTLTASPNGSSDWKQRAKGTSNLSPNPAAVTITHLNLTDIDNNWTAWSIVPDPVKALVGGSPNIAMATYGTTPAICKGMGIVFMKQ
jgi:hypothetical protein